jgi:orotate phosphoribosyltransferase
MLKIDEQIALDLLNSSAISLRPNEPFTWASGIKSPIYCDNRVTLSYPEVRERITDAFVSLIKEKYSDVNVIAGVATAGIPQAALVAQRMGLPMVYVRSKAKDHGKENLIEGRVEKGQKCIVIEDLISTGGSCLIAVDALKSEGVEVLAVCAIFTYLLNKATSSFEAHQTKLETLSNYDVLMKVALSKNLIKEEDLELLKKWKKDPASWLI